MHRITVRNIKGNTGKPLAFPNGLAAPYKVVSSAYTAVPGDRLLADTAGGAFTITLPAGSLVGSTVEIADASGSWSVNPLTVVSTAPIVGESTPVALPHSVHASTYGAEATFIYDGSRWLEVDTVTPPPPAPTFFGGRAVFGGGGNPTYGTPVANIDYVAIGTLGNAAVFGTLSVATTVTAATSNASRAVFGGGFATSVVAAIQFFAVGVLGVAAAFGSLTAAREMLAAVSNGSRGVYGGGGNGAATPVIDYIAIGTLGNAIAFGNIAVGKRSLTAVSNIARGVFCGGSADANVVVARAVMEYIVLSTAGNAVNFGSLVEPTFNSAAASDGSRGVIGGGQSGAGARLASISYLAIAVLGNSVNFGSLTGARTEVSATSDGSRGIFGGGTGAGAAASTMEYITIGTLGNAINFGNLAAARYAIAATSGD